VAQDDRALALALDDDRRRDDDVTLVGAFLPLLDHDRDGVRDLLAQLEKQLLADQLPRQEPLAAVGEHLRPVERRPGRQQPPQLADQPIDVGSLRRRHRDDGAHGFVLAPAFEQRQQQRLRLERVDLVDRQRDGTARLDQLVQDRLLGTARPAPAGADVRRDVHVDDQQGRVDVGNDAHRLVHHETVEALLRAVNAGRVDEDNLAPVRVVDARDPVAGRLRLRRDDR
jgi:hypothetical protein